MNLRICGLGLALASVGVGCSSSSTTPSLKVQHVLLISVDGMHESDLANWIASNPSSNLAQLSKAAVTYSAASTTTPSDSFPGTLALATGGTSKSTGVYYDDSYDRTLYPPGSGCDMADAGTEVVYDESLDFDNSQLFSGGINPQNLPLEKSGTACTPVYPHTFLKVNTIFEVVKAAGGITAWSDKHPAYDILNGPSGLGVGDLYTPEINSDIANGGTVNGVNLAATLAQCDGTNSLPPAKVQVYTDCLPACEAYDDVKVQAVVNQIHGLKSDGTTGPGVPALFGMNFQEVSVGEKLPVGGYDGGTAPSAVLNAALAHTDAAIGKMVAALTSANLLSSTAIIITAKHGQSPIQISNLAMESGATHAPNQTVQDPLSYVNNADPNVDQVLWTNNNTVGPTQGHTYANDGHLQTDDVGLVWLQDQSATNIAAVVAQLTLPANATAMFANMLPSGTIFTSNITSGSALAAIFGDPTSSDPVASARAPNVFIQPNLGVIYSGSSKKIAEHGGGSADDTHVALMVAWPSLSPSTVSAPVTTAQVAPTILQALGSAPSLLQAVQKEETAVLPGLF